MTNAFVVFVALVAIGCRGEQLRRTERGELTAAIQSGADPSLNKSKKSGVLSPLLGLLRRTERGELTAAIQSGADKSILKSKYPELKPYPLDYTKSGGMFGKGKKRDPPTSEADGAEVGAVLPVGARNAILAMDWAGCGDAVMQTGPEGNAQLKESFGPEENAQLKESFDKHVVAIARKYHKHGGQLILAIGAIRPKKWNVDHHPEEQIDVLSKATLLDHHLGFDLTEEADPVTHPRIGEAWSDITADLWAEDRGRYSALRHRQAAKVTNAELKEMKEAEEHAVDRFEGNPEVFWYQKLRKNPATSPRPDDFPDTKRKSDETRAVQINGKVKTKLIQNVMRASMAQFKNPGLDTDVFFFDDMAEHLEVVRNLVVVPANYNLYTGGCGAEWHAKRHYQG